MSPLSIHLINQSLNIKEYHDCSVCLIGWQHDCKQPIKHDIDNFLIISKYTFWWKIFLILFFLSEICTDWTMVWIGKMVRTVIVHCKQILSLIGIQYYHYTNASFIVSPETTQNKRPVRGPHHSPDQQFLVVF